MNDMKKAMEIGIYRRVLEVKDILDTWSNKEGEINPSNIIDYVVLNSCNMYTTYDIEERSVKEIRPDGSCMLSDGEVRKFYREDYQICLPKTKFCMEILKCYFGLIEDFSEDIWEDIQYYGISKSCATMLNEFENSGRISILK